MSHRKNKKFSKFLLKNLEQLHSISSAESKQAQNDLLSEADADLISAIVEIATNCLLGNIYCSENRRQKLKTYKSELENIRKIRRLSKKLKLEKELIIRANSRIDSEQSLFSLLLPPALATISLNLVDER